MPIYEFVCNGCRARSSVFVRTVFSEVNARCERCGGSDLRRLVSRVAVKRSTDLSGLDDASLMAAADESDPRALASMARQMQSEMGGDMGPEFDEMVERLDRGESIDDAALGGLDDGLDDF